MSEDIDLLRQFADEGSEAAFAELVRRRIDLVYAVALRTVGGDAHLAQDVTQSVFLDLARRAGSLRHRDVLVSWLYTSTRFAAAKAVRTQARWLEHQQKANAMQQILSTGVTPDWNEIRPDLDEAMDKLAEPDRTAILLRFFEGRPLTQVGAALGIGENAARMRVDRALDKLRAKLARRGITSTAAALGAALAQQPALSAPAGLAALVAETSVASAAAGVLASAATSAGTLMGTTKTVLGTAGVAALLGFGIYLNDARPAQVAPPSNAAKGDPLLRQISEIRAENRRLGAEASQLVATLGALPPGPLGVADALPSAIEIRNQVTANLAYMSSALAKFRRDRGRNPESMDELYRVANFRRAIPVDGENYDKVDLTGGIMIVTTPAGQVVAYNPTRPPELLFRYPEMIDQAYSAFLTANRGRLPTAQELVPYIEPASYRAKYVESLGATSP